MADKQTPDLEPIAVIGMGCRFSGGSNSIDSFWEMLHRGRKGHGPVPANRYQASAWEHPSHERKGAINNDSGFFLAEDPAEFDAPFFSITSKEAAGMDPAQRLMLEVAYEAFENGGIPMESLPGSNVGIYAGCMTNDYELLSACDIMDMSHNSATGNGRTMLANRLSWFFDLRGPSIMMDTACSSSLTALHLATQALRAGDCNTAMVTGASLILHPNFTQRLSYMHMLSEDGISHSFDSRANGYGRGEGFGAVLLKPLSKALGDGNRIRAVVRATGSNQDGRTPGITMPSADAQADLIRATYRQAHLSTRDTSYFEAHGTGTEIGDPTELSAIGATFGAERIPGDEPLYVGSVKTNVGHTEGAAGVASLIKVILCLEKGMLVPNAGFQELNPRIRLDEWGIRLSNSTMPWPGHLPQRASINSFGFGGSNAHAILESAAQYTGSSQQPNADASSSTPQVIVVSAHDRAGLERTAEKWKNYLDSHSDKKHGKIALPDVAHTMAVHRSQLGFRSFTVVDSLQELRDQMAKGLPSFPRVSQKSTKKLALIFTGQGAQWARMGAQLFANPVFVRSMDCSQQALQRMGCPWNLREEIFRSAPDSLIDRPDRSQPICCALQIALVDVLRSWEASPKAVIGHSSGEAGAAYAAGYLNQEDALRIMYHRGVLSQRLAETGHPGGMLAVGMSPAEVETYIQYFPTGSVVIACVNSPSSVTLSGDRAVIHSLSRRLQIKGHFARKLRVNTAYHSPYMAEVVDDYREAIKCIKPVNYSQNVVCMFSSVTKARIHPEELGAEYWIRNLVSPVEFAAAVTNLVTMTEKHEGRRRATPVKWGAFLEIGPHEALKGPFAQTVQQVNASLTSTPYAGLMLRQHGAQRTTMQAAGLLWAVGCSINLEKTNKSLLGSREPRMVQDLPSYAWNHQSSFWHEPLASTRLRRRVEARHDLLGVPLDYQNDIEPRWRNFLRVVEQPWIADHVVAGSVVFPAAGMVAMIAEAARQLADPRKWLSGIDFQDLEFFRGLPVPSDDNGIEVGVNVRPYANMPGWFEFGIFSLADKTAWTQHARGTFNIQYDADCGETSTADWEWMTLRVQQTRNTSKEIENEAVYKWLSETGGVTLGRTFRSMDRLFFHPSSPRIYVSGIAPDTMLTMPDERESSYFIHPTCLDVLFQAAVLSCSDSLSGQEANIPVAVERLYLSTDFSLHPGDQFAVHTEARFENGTWLSESIASDSSWKQPGVILQGVRLGRVPMRSQLAGASIDSPKSRFSTIDWVENLDSFPGADEQVSYPGGLESFMERVCHSHGNAKALVVTTVHTAEALTSSFEAFVSKSVSHPRLQQLTVLLCAPDSEETDAKIKVVEKALSGCQVLTAGSLQDVDSSLLDSTIYHSIIVDYPLVWSGDNIAPLLDNLPTMCEPDAWFALRAPSSNRDEAVRQISSNADWEVRGSMQEDDCLVLRRRSSHAALDPVVYVLTAWQTDIPTSLWDVLRSSLLDLGANVELVTVCDMPDLTDKTVISLVEMYVPWTADWNETEMKQFQSLLKAKSLLWVAQSPHHTAYVYAASGATSGLLRTLRNEDPNVTLSQLFVDENGMQNETSLAKGIAHVLQLSKEAGSRSRDWEFYARDGRLLVPRVVAAKLLDDTMEGVLNGPQPALADLGDDERPLRLRIEPSQSEPTPWEPDTRLESALDDDQIEVQLDMVTLSDTTRKANIALEARIEAVEAVGTVCRVGKSFNSAFAVGDGVVCLIPGDASFTGIATRVRVAGDVVWHRPEQQSQEQSVSMPLAYSAAYASLFGNPGPFPSSVLIAGRISQILLAIVDCALAVGLQLYVAIDGDDAIHTLGSRYPGLKGHIVPVHRGLEMTISRLTSSKGIDLGLCCQGGFFSRLVGCCLAPNGRLVDLSEELNVASLPQKMIDRGCAVGSVRLSRMLHESPRQLQTHLRSAIELFAGRKEALASVPSYPIFPVSQLAAAITHAREVGTRVIVDLQAPGQVSIIPTMPEPASLQAENTYLLAGGLGTIGLALANTLATCGARHLVFLVRSGPAHKTQNAALRVLHDQGVRTDVIRCDVARREDVQALLAQAKESRWCIRGVVQCATVLKDCIFENMSFEEWKQSTESKIQGTINLHELLIGTRLDFFVALSSVASVIGNIGQANYAAGNAFMDSLMVWRRQHGLAGHSINIGLVPDASGVSDVAEMAADRRQRYQHLEGTEIMLEELQSLLQVIVLGQSLAPAQVIAGITNVLPRVDSSAAWQFDRKFEHRVQVATSDHTDAGAALKASALLRKADSVDAAVRLVSELLQKYLAGAMAAAPESIDLELPLSALGVDSLKVAEVQNWVSREMGAELSSFEFLGSQPVKALAEKITAVSSFIPAMV